jgi:hypothetical protein
MKILIPLLVLSSVVARSAIAHDAEQRVLRWAGSWATILDSQA